jgi:hypothetical protein
MPNLLERSPLQAHPQQSNNETMGDNGDCFTRVFLQDVVEGLENTLLHLYHGFPSRRRNSPWVPQAPFKALAVTLLDLAHQQTLPFALVDLPQAGIGLDLQSGCLS